MTYDLLIIGSGPAARAAALAAAALRRHVALVAPSEEADSSEARPEHLRAVVSRLLEERRGNRPTLADLHRELAEIARADGEEGERRLVEAGTDFYRGAARFLDEATVVVETGSETVTLAADRILIATGTRPGRPGYVPFAPPQIVTADELRAWEALPPRVAIVGGGTTGREHARLLAALGAAVSVVDARPEIGTGGDFGEADELPHPACLPNVAWRSGVEAIGAARLAGGGVSVALDDGGRIVADAALWCTERIGATRDLDLPAAGIVPDERGRLWCNDQSRTWAPGIYAAGDVVGYPPPAEDEARAARRIVEHALGAAAPHTIGGFRRRGAQRARVAH
ncbi:MAG: FAD-dependent oxidoreductase [Planctomycetales bacterium]